MKSYPGLATHVRPLYTDSEHHTIFMQAKDNYANRIIYSKKQVLHKHSVANLRNLEEVCLPHSAQKLTKDA